MERARMRRKQKNQKEVPGRVLALGTFAFAP